MIKHSQIIQNNKFITSLQYLKIEVRSGGQFWPADKRQRFYNGIILIDGSGQTCSKYPK